MTAGQGIDGAQPVRILLGYGVDHHGREVELLLETAALVWMLAGPSPTDQTHAPEITESRESTVNRLMAAAEYEKAITLFESLFEGDANPAWIFNIAVAYDMWGRCEPALETFERYSTLCANVECPHAEITEARRQRVLEKCSQSPPSPDAGIEPPDAAPQPGRLLWEVPKRAEIRIDGVLLKPPGSGLHEVESGTHVVNLALPSHGAVVLDVELNPGQSLKVGYYPPDRAWRGWTGAALVGLGAILSAGAVWAFRESDQAADRSLDDPNNLSHVRAYQDMYGWGMGLSLTAGLVSVMGLGLGTWAFLDPDSSYRAPTAHLPHASETSRNP